MSELYCKYCKEPTVYGDERNAWASYHGAWWHRLYWRLKYRFYICPKQGHHFIYAGRTLGGDWIRCYSCNKLDEYLPGVHEPEGYDKAHQW